jgi:Xaa-Pro aminopeptidase
MNELPIPPKTVFAASPAEVRLEALRGALAQADLHGFLVPRADEHQGEYVPKAAERLHFLTGFTGSAGLAIVLSERAAVFVDGRYTLQVEAEVDRRLYEICHLSKTPPWDWLAEAAKRGQRIAYDPWLHTPDGLARLKAAAAKAGRRSSRRRTRSMRSGATGRRRRRRPSCRTAPNSRASPRRRSARRWRRSWPPTASRRR